METDYQPLLYLGKAQYGQNGRVMRWALVLQQFTIRAIKGSENVGAEFLSPTQSHVMFEYCVTVCLFVCVLYS